LTDLYNRYWELRIKDINDKFDYTLKPDPESGINLKLSFDITATTDIRYYTGTIKVWNLGREKRKNLVFNLLLEEFGTGPLIQLSAGYLQRYGIIFDGAINRGYLSRDAQTGNWINVMQCGIPLKQDAFFSIKSQPVKNGTLYSFLSSAVKKVINQPGRFSVKLAKNFDSNFKLAVDEYLKTNTVDKNIGYSGPATGILNEISREFNIIFFAGPEGFSVISGKFGSDNDRLSINDPEIEISEGTGMIGSPIYTDTGAKVLNYLNPHFKMFQKAHVISDVLDKNISIYSLTHRGDWREKEWYSEIDGSTVNPFKQP